MILTVSNDFARYKIFCPPDAEVKLDHDGTDFLLVPDPDDPEVPFWLWDDILLDAARSNELGLRVLSVDAFN